MRIIEGILKSIKARIMLMSYYFARLLERIKGVEFIKPFTNSNLYGDTYHISSSSGGKNIVDVIKSLNIRASDSIIDIGCGKGRAINLMRGFPFKKIDGIEFIEEISILARKNFSILREKRVTIYCEDATKFDNYALYNYFYFYNPFAESIFKIVLNRIIESVTENPRTIKIIYVNPICHQYIISSGFLLISEFKDEFKNSIPVYKYPII